MTGLLPRYYLAHETPAGWRFAYPRPALEGYPTHWEKPEVTWTTITGVGAWLVSNRVLDEVTASWLPPTCTAGWRKRPTQPDDPYVRGAWDTAPEVPTEADSEHWNAHDVEDCIRCQMFTAIYDQDRVQPPPETRTVDVTDWAPLPGAPDPDPDPDREWVTDDPSMTVIYGAHTAHLWPGQLPGLRDQVYALLKDDPRVQHVFDAKNHHDQQPGSLQTTVPIRWETPRTVMRTRTGARGQTLRGKRSVPDPIAHTVRTTARVPAGCHGATKAAALAAWNATVAEYVGRLLPVDVVACDRCGGHGHLLPDHVSEAGQ
ncbi:MAG: hypothetical protein ACRDRO_26030 [Pseudonocardiaceae bacterium]